MAPNFLVLDLLLPIAVLFCLPMLLWTLKGKEIPQAVLLAHDDSAIINKAYRD